MDKAKKMPQILHTGDVAVTMKFSWNEISLGRYAGVQVIIGVAKFSGCERPNFRSALGDYRWTLS
jgi:hypothetical protein